MTYPLSRPADEVKPHDPLKAVRGGQFRGGYDVFAPGAQLLSPIQGKIAHVYRYKTQCLGAKILAAGGLSQFTISEETIDEDHDRHLTGFRIFVARVGVLPEIGHTIRHVPEDLTIGWVEDWAHFSSNQDARLRQILRLP